MRTDDRQKRQREEQRPLKSSQEADKFIRTQEQAAEKSIFDWREMQAKGNAQKLAAIKKERLDAELRYTQEKLQAKMVAEQIKATKDIEDAQLLSLNADSHRG